MLSGIQSPTKLTAAESCDTTNTNATLRQTLRVLPPCICGLTAIWSGHKEVWLLMQRAERDQDWPGCRLVFNCLGRTIGSHIKGWKKACRAAQMPGLYFHDLRRSAVRNMERAGIPRKVAMSISGHKTEAIYQRYDIVSPQDLKIAAAKMENYLDGLRAGGNVPVATEPQQNTAESRKVN